VQCAATLASGKSCRREARPNAQLCAFHAGLEQRRQARGFYTTRLSAEEQGLLAAAGQLDGVDAEIAVLRVLIRRVVTAGDLEAARRGIDTLCRTLKARHELDDQAAGTLAASLERVLDSLGRELEVAL
jgi:hypothetical protein